MKKSIYALVLSVVVGTGLAWSHEGHDSEHGAGGKEVTVKGELIDMACYMAHEGKGKKHGDCAKMCVLGGSPLGILTTDGKVYLLVEDHSSSKAKKPYSQAKKLVAETVTIKGDAYERGGTQAIVVESVTKE
ncbi:MAG: hypothetical protein HY077_03840 [Elusimicrobia bacterium]|nr:hypothetical protein [Elusimicrobiota bacterium]